MAFSEAELSAVEADHLEHADLGSNTESSRGYESQETNVPNGADTKSSSPPFQAEKRVTAEGANDTLSNPPCSFHDETQGCQFENSQPTSEVERMARHAHMNGQSQSSLFSDSFRLEV
ncbi:unnamed protein product [Gongylonema pulchrum]|uniref:Uncharacterized protein n=1 Tax=Gongylonema pulchrum TaxID=637853 RepID=A0A183DG86_9BILA|nr:unnamed protein product [Gongylonema pulchrum]VDK62537.1 unnamed protein product [Gongylonema pulchrum]